MIPYTTDINILIPMAGAGSRFSQAGYDKPKPLIDVGGVPMIQRVVENIGIPGKYIFLVRSEHIQDYPTLVPTLKSLAESVEIVEVAELTEGAACTALLARDLINNSTPLLTANSDQIQDWFPRDFLDFTQNVKQDGVIVTFHSDSENNSYAKLDNNGNVLETKEKVVISRVATTGVYYWHRGKDFVDAADSMIEKNIRSRDEFYMCPVYNENIEMGQVIKVFHIDCHWPIGTPEELTIYKKERLGM
ncbi:MAG: glycosyltransferase family 2 protein [Nitrosomonadaceae bacterium]